MPPQLDTSDFGFIGMTLRWWEADCQHGRVNAIARFLQQEQMEFKC